MPFQIEQLGGGFVGVDGRVSFKGPFSVCWSFLSSFSVAHCSFRFVWNAFFFLLPRRIRLVVLSWAGTPIEFFAKKEVGGI